MSLNYRSWHVPDKVLHRLIFVHLSAERMPAGHSIKRMKLGNLAKMSLQCCFRQWLVNVKKVCSNSRLILWTAFELKRVVLNRTVKFASNVEHG